MLCGSPATVSGEALYAAFSQGGEAAEVAVAALLAYECPSGDSDAILDAAFRAFTQQDALYDADTAYRWAGSLGTRCCCGALLVCCLLCAKVGRACTAQPIGGSSAHTNGCRPSVRPACVSATLGHPLPACAQANWSPLPEHAPCAHASHSPVAPPYAHASR